MQLSIQNPDHIDIIGLRNDGGVDMTIITTGPLHDSDLLTKVVEEKIQTYLLYINSNEYLFRFGPPTKEKTKIIIKSDSLVSDEFKALITQFQPWVSENNATLILQST